MATECETCGTPLLSSEQEFDLCGRCHAKQLAARILPLCAENERLKAELRQAGDGIAKVALLSSMLKPRDFAALQAVTTRIEQVLDGKIEGPTIERLQAALARKNELLRECREVAWSMATTRRSQADSTSHEPDKHFYEAESHKCFSLCDRIDKEIGGGDGQKKT